MSSLLQQLNNESILLLYIAGELPAEDRADVEAMLANDPRVRAEYDALRAAYESAGEAIADADRSERLVLSESTAVRRVGNAAKAWHVRRLASPPEVVDTRRIRFPRWVYPTAACAAVIVASVSWWVQQDRGPIVLLPTNPPATTFPSDEGSNEFASEPPLETFVLVDETDTALADAEDELYALSQRVDDGSGILLFNESDAR